MTHNKFIEVMQVPVLSTAHLPDEYAVHNSTVLNAPYEGGWFVWLGSEPQTIDTPWMEDVRKWAQRISPSCEWVRFESCGDVICELEKYEW